MTVVWSPDDLAYMLDFKETVSLIKVEPDGNETTYTGVTAIGCPEPDRLIDSGGVQHVERPARWDVQVSTLESGVVLARGDRIVSTSTAMAGTYVVQNAELLTRATRWQCETLKLLDP